MNTTTKQHSRGAASVEAVIVLPVFVILFVGMLFVRDLTGARLAADQEVRRCSWQYALQNDCGTKPPGCDKVVGDGHYGDLMPKYKSAFDDLGKSGQSQGMQGTKGFLAVQRILENFVVEYLAQAVTKRFNANKAIERNRPGLFGGGKVTVQGKYGLACNVPAQKQDNVVTAVWNQFKP